MPVFADISAGIIESLPVSFMSRRLPRPAGVQDAGTRRDSGPLLPPTLGGDAAGAGSCVPADPAGAGAGSSAGSAGGADPMGLLGSAR